MAHQVQAVCLISPNVVYRRQAFVSGLTAAGFEVVPHIQRPHKSDLLVTWNRYGIGEDEANRYEANGARVIVAENGYIGASESEFRKPFDRHGNQLFALAIGGHNGSGTWVVGDENRWREQGIELRPWRTDGEHVLVLPQRGIGPRGTAMPIGWTERTVERLRTERPIVVRAHPGGELCERSLEEDLDGAWCCVTWGSGAAIKALALGYPVFYEFKNWIAASACRRFGQDIEAPASGCASRRPLFASISWAQWPLPEIASGKAFATLLARQPVAQVA